MSTISLFATSFVTPVHFSHFSNSKRAYRDRIKLVAHCASPHDSPEHRSYSVSRRSLLLSAAAFFATTAFPYANANSQSTETIFFTLPDLPYRYDALEPRISEKIMRAHHDAHFATYVRNLNGALNAIPDRLRPAASDDGALRRLLARLQDIEDTSIRSMLRNNGGGYLNHKQFFTQMSPKPGALPNRALAKRIDKDFGSFESFKQEFLTAAATLFGSGFVWLVRDAASGKLRITKYANQDNPAMDGDGNVSLLGCDCWEHAWYYDYGPKKGDYFKAWWELVDWPSVNALYVA